MVQSKVLIMYFCTLTILYCAQTEITDMHNPESVELIRSMETAYCSVREDYVTCNEVESRICLNKRCINACSLKNLHRCICKRPNADPCTLCCGGATSACMSADNYGMFSFGGEKWFRQSERENCAKDAELLCPSADEGKVCAVSTIGFVEYPRICSHRKCAAPKCAHLTKDGGQSIADCECPAQFNKYPTCCKSTTNSQEDGTGGKCTPYQFFLKTETLRIRYIENIASANSFRFGSNELETVGAWQICNAESTIQRCGPAHRCKNNACTHICNNPAFECYCDPGSKEECHLCCLVDGGCKSILSIDPSLKSQTTGGTGNFFHKVGRPCNFTLGTCDISGICRKLTKHPTLSCSDDNDCGAESICQDNRCAHMCGTLDRRCICSPDSNQECHICCLTSSGPDAKCEGVTKSTAGSQPSKLHIHPVGTPCNFTYGSCTSEGKCVSSAIRPREYCPINGAPCGQYRTCQNNNCAHMCGGSGANECICSVASLGECHLCCKRGDICQSVYDGKDTSLLRELGTPCNYTFGTCDSFGSCRPVKNHPSYSFCYDTLNDGNQCGEKHQCVDRECRHVCGRTSAECQCASSSTKECHICCQRGDTCDSVYDGRNAKQSFLLKPTGTGCNFTYGYCDGFGNCQPVKQHPAFSKCRDPTNDGRSCGENQICTQSACSNVCGSPLRHCQCTPNTKNECHHCCIDPVTKKCESVYDGKNANLLKAQGTSCNFTFGLCSSTGSCQKVQRHPYESSICAIPENNHKPCGPKRVCDGSQCVHVCDGSELNECICNPEDTADECHICCSIPEEDGCQSMFKIYQTNYFLRPIGSSCDHSKGVCDKEGTCTPSDKYCRIPDNRNQQCGTASYCDQYGRCQHACGGAQNLCICSAGSVEECHLCCYNQTEGAFGAEDPHTNLRFTTESPSRSKDAREIVSANNNNHTAICSSVFTEELPFLVRSPGSSCNYTLGVCSRSGICGAVEHHPFARKYTDRGDDRNYMDYFTLAVILIIDILLT